MVLYFLHQMIHMADFHDPIRAENNDNRNESCEENVADLNFAVTTFRHMHEHKQL